MSTPQELPGMLALALAIQKGEWPHTLDAKVWAQEWAKHYAANPEIASDEGTMIGWFANAIMAGYDTAMVRADRMRARGDKAGEAQQAQERG